MYIETNKQTNRRRAGRVCDELDRPQVDIRAAEPAASGALCAAGHVPQKTVGGDYICMRSYYM